MPKLPVPSSPGGEDVTEGALASWGRTARLCVILLAGRAAPVLAAVAWLVTRK